MSAGSGGYGGPNFSQIASELRNVAVQFTSIQQAVTQLNASVQTFRTLERELTTANFAASGTVKTFFQMEDAARRFALSSKFSASQVANSFYNLASAGLTAKQALAAATGVLLLSQAAMIDLGEASDVVASSMAQFGLDASEATRVSNLFVASTNRSLSTVPKLAFAMRQVGPIAAQAGLSIEETVGALDKLFDAGLRGEQAGTALRNAIARIIDPMGDGAVLLQNLGIQAYDASGKMRNFIDILTDLSKQKLTLSDISNIAGVEAASGFATLLKSVGNTRDGLRQHIAEISNTSDAYRQAVAQMNTLDGSISQSLNAFNELRITLGETLAPVIMDVAHSFVDFVNVVRDMDKAMLASYAQLIIGAGAFAMLLKGVAGLTGTLATMSKGWASMTTGVIAAQNAMQAFGAGVPVVGMRAASNAVSSVASGLLGIAGAAAGILGTAVAIGALTAAVVKLQEAKKKEREQQFSDYSYQEYADTKGLPKDITLMGLQTKGDPLKAVDEMNKNRKGLFNVDKQTGEGATSLMQALTSDVTTVDHLITQAETQLKALQQHDAKYREQMRKTFGDVFAGVMGGVQYALNTTSSQSLTPQFRQAMQEFTYAPAQNIRDATKQMYANMRRAVEENKNIPADTRASILKSLQKSQEAVLRLPDEALVELQNQLTDELPKHATDAQFARQNPLIKALQETMKRVAPKESELAEVEAEHKATISGLKARIAQMRGTQDSLNQAVAQEIRTTVIDSYGDSQEKAQILSHIMDSDPALMQKAVQDVRKNGGELRTGLKDIIDEAIKQRGDIFSETSDGLEAAMSTPLIDRRKAAQAARKARLDEEEAALDLAKLQGKDDPKKNVSHILAVAQFDQQNMFWDEFANLAKTGGDANYNKNLASEKAISAWQTFTKTQSKADFDKVAEAMNLRNQGISADVLNDFYTKVVAQANTVNLQGQAKVQQYNQQHTATERSMDKVLNMPNAADLERERRELEIETRYYVEEFFNMPWAAYKKGLESTHLDYDKKRAELQKTFETMYRNSLAKGSQLDLNQQMINAFSGYDGLIDAATGAAYAFEYKGKKFASVMLENADTASDYMNAALNAFIDGLPKDTPEYQMRIENAKRMLTELPTRLADLNDYYAEELHVMEIKRRELAQQMQEFVNKFNGEDLMRLYDLLGKGQAAGLQIPQPVLVDLALKARIAKVDIDAQQAKAELRDKFKEFFTNEGVGVAVDADGRLVFDGTIDKTAFDLFDTSVDKFGRAVDRLAGGTGGSNANVSTNRVGSISEADARAAVAKLFPGAVVTSGARSPAHQEEMKRRGYKPSDSSYHLQGKAIDFVIKGMSREAVRDVLEGAGLPIAELLHEDPGTKNEHIHWAFANRNANRDASAGVAPLTAPIVPNAPGMGDGPNWIHGASGQQLEDLKANALDYYRQLSEGSGKTADEIERNGKRVVDAWVHMNQEADVIDDTRKKQEDFYNSLSQGDRNILSQADALEQAQAAWDAYRGSVEKANVTMAQAALNAAQARLGVTTETANMPGTDPQVGMGNVYAGVVSKKQAELELERTQQIQETTRALEAVGATEEEIGKSVSEINAYYEQRKALVADQADTEREVLDIMIQQRTAMYNGVGEPATQMWEGLKTGALQAAKEMSTPFETGMQAAGQAINGFAELGAQAILGMSQNWRQGVASLLQSIAMLIAKMLIMAAVIQLIRAIPGGSVVLAALDMGAKATGHADGGVGGSSMPFSGQYALGGVGGHFNAYATGGAAGWQRLNNTAMNAQQLIRGGVKGAKQTEVAIFGEGNYPEAFVPMLDRRTVPVEIDGNGNARIPLPSGQTIPVSLRGAFGMSKEPKKFREGGIFGKIARQVADKVAHENEDIPNRRAGIFGKAAAAVVHQTTTHYDIGGITVQVQGNASEKDSESIGKEVARQLQAFIELREAEQQRKAHRQGGSHSFSPGGFG